MTSATRKLSTSQLNEVALDLLRARGVARALVLAVSVFGESGYAIQWLKEPNEALGGAIPLRLLATVEGDEIVRAELGAIEHGLPA